MAGVVGRQGARKESASHGRRVTRPECITGFMKRFCRVASPPGGVGAAGGGGREGERIVLNCSRRIKTEFAFRWESRRTRLSWPRVSRVNGEAVDI